MSVLYIVEQGASLHKNGNLLVVEKGGEEITSVHAFKVEQVILVGNVRVSPPTIAFLLEEGIDTVFLSSKGKYRGRLISQFGKNIVLRRFQFRKMDDPAFCLELAKCYAEGKLKNCRTLLRRHHRELNRPEIEASIHMLRNMLEKIGGAGGLDVLRGIEGKGANSYFQGFKHAIRAEGMPFESRNRRPPRDAVNALLSFGYALLGNTVHTAANIVGLDPYLGCLHAVDYGRPSLVLDLMEEFRPILVDALLLRVLNRRVITPNDFYFQEGGLPLKEGEELEDLASSDYPVHLTHQGIKKWLVHYEKHLQEKVYYPRMERPATYKDICLEQARLLVRHLKGEETYTSFLVR